MNEKLKHQSSNRFGKSIRKVIAGIVFFVCLYLSLVALSVGFVSFCWEIAKGLLTTFIGIKSFLLALGLMAVSLMIFVFLIKFIFKRYKEENQYSIQVFEKDYPKLFQTIREVAEEVGTEFPAKVFLVHNVNASVSYNSSIWSLFLPVKRNLNIGLGLVNGLNVGEFKAVLAHT